MKRSSRRFFLQTESIFIFLGFFCLIVFSNVGAVATTASKATTGVYNKCPKWGGDLFHIFGGQLILSALDAGEQHQHGNGHRYTVPDEQ